MTVCNVKKLTHDDIPSEIYDNSVFLFSCVECLSVLQLIVLEK